MRKLLMMTMMLFVAIGASAKADLQTVVFTTTPQMHCQNCENKIKGNLKYEKGVKKIETNVDEQTVTVTFDAKKTSEDKILKAFEKFGYQARKLAPGESVVKQEGGGCSNM